MWCVFPTVYSADDDVGRNLHTASCEISASLNMALMDMMRTEVHRDKPDKHQLLLEL